MLAVMDPTLIFGMVAAMAILLMVRGSLMRISKNKRRKDPTSEDGAAGVRDKVRVRDDLQQLIVDLQELSRQLNAQIDTRACKLEVLIKEADERIRRLETLSGSSGSPAAGSVEQPERNDPQREMIYKLADSGKSPVEIAQELNKNTGEIELILSLRRSGAKGSNRLDYRIG